MKTALDIDRDLLDEAKRTFQARTYTETIERALREAVDRRRRMALIDHLASAPAGDLEAALRARTQWGEG